MARYRAYDNKLDFGAKFFFIKCLELSLEVTLRFLMQLLMRLSKINLHLWMVDGGDYRNSCNNITCTSLAGPLTGGPQCPMSN